MKAFSGGKFRTQGLFVLAGMQGALQHALWGAGLHCHKAMPARLRALAAVQPGASGTAKDAAKAAVAAQWPHMQWPSAHNGASAAAVSTDGDQADAGVAALGGAALLDAAAACVGTAPLQARDHLMYALPKSTLALVQGDAAPAEAASAWAAAQQAVASSVTGQGFRGLTRHHGMLQNTAEACSAPYALNTPPLLHTAPGLGTLRGPARAAAVHSALQAMVTGRGTNSRGGLPEQQVQWLLPALLQAQPSTYTEAWVAALAGGGGAWGSVPPRTLRSATKRAVAAMCA